jgi:hypothetical protein
MVIIKNNIMCPICILTYIVYLMSSILGFFGFKKIVQFIKLKYHIWSGTKCEKCKNLERNGYTRHIK